MLHPDVWSRFFVHVNGKKLWRHKRYKKWYDKLDSTQRTRLATYVKRVARGESLNNVKGPWAGVSEIKMGGLRVYFAEDEQTVFLLNGGDKDTKGGQSDDIGLSQERWRMLCKKNGDLLTKS